jgi:hypothetical protein
MAGNKPKAKRRGCLRFSVGCLGLLFILLVIFAGLAIAFKPDEKALRSEACKKSGSIACGAGSTGETLGLYKISYHDHTVFSTLTLKLPGDTERTVALGALGQVIALELPDPPKIR